MGTEMLPEMSASFKFYAIESVLETWVEKQVKRN
jgi:hypothetical protein